VLRRYFRFSAGALLAQTVLHLQHEGAVRAPQTDYGRPCTDLSGVSTQRNARNAFNATDGTDATADEASDLPFDTASFIINIKIVWRLLFS